MSRDGAARNAVARALPHPLYFSSFKPHIDALRQQYPRELESLDVRGNQNAVRMVACAQSESAFEYTNAKGARTGAFTEALLEVLQEIGDVAISWRVLAQAVRERVLRTFPSQRPDVEGPQHRRLFSLDEDARGIVPVTTTPTGVQLAAGRLHGVSVGDIYGVMPVGATSFDDKTAVALVSVTATSGSSSDANVTRWLNGNSAIPGQAIAVPREIAATRRAIKLEVPEEHRAMIERAIVDTRTLRPAVEQTDRPLVTLRLASGKLTIEDERGALFPPAAYPGELEGTVGNLKGIGVAQGLRELEGEYGVSAQREVTIELGIVDDGKLRVLPERGASLGLGDRICIRVKSRAMRTLYAHVFNVGVRGTVSRLTSFAAAGVPLNPGDELILGQNFGTGALEGLQLFWPEGLPIDSFPRIDEAVVIVTSAPADLGGLETQAFLARTRGAGTQLAALLGQLHTGQTRDMGNKAAPEQYLVKRLSYFLHPRIGSIGGIDFAVDENPQLRASARTARAWTGGSDPAGEPGSGAASGAIAIRLSEFVADKNAALSSPDIRIDALVCTRSETAADVRRATTLRFKSIKDGRPSLDSAVLWLGRVHDFVDVYLWVSPDKDRSLDLAELFQQPAVSHEVQDALTALRITPTTITAPWITAVGASAVLARAAYQRLRKAIAEVTGLYRTSFLASERFGVGRHPVEGLHPTRDFSFSLAIDAASTEQLKRGQ